ncbi:MAG: beta-galactosidase, partial [Treponema sp.]|nr:beta-galactosidase [Treponema sp.]
MDIPSNRLYTGTNYHPHDWPESRWETDFRLMKDASFNIVRLGHLCWDSFEPAPGVFSFDWFDRALDLCVKYGLMAVVDIPTRPAPLWLHKKFPGITVTGPEGRRLYPHSRYMEDVGHPRFQEFALGLAKNMASRYGDHPAVLAFG